MQILIPNNESSLIIRPVCEDLEIYPHTGLVPGSNIPTVKIFAKNISNKELILY